MVLCCEGKLQKPIKGKDGTIFLRICSLLQLFCTCQTLFQGQIVVLSSPATKGAWYFGQEDEEGDFTFTLVDIKSVFGSVNNYLLLTFLYGTQAICDIYVQVLRDNATEENTVSIF